MRIFVDADACPKLVKEILYKAAIRTQTELILVANQYLSMPKSSLIRAIQVTSGFDEADRRIVAEVEDGDIVITADIPLADLVTNKNAIAVNPRGRLYTKDNIKQQLATRNLMEQLRDNQMLSGGGVAKFGKLDGHALANQLDWLLANKK